MDKSVYLFGPLGLDILPAAETHHEGPKLIRKLQESEKRISVVARIILVAGERSKGQGRREIEFQ